MAFAWTDTPNPEWKTGTKLSELSSPVAKEWLEAMKNDFKIWDPSSTSPSDMYRILIGGIVPRPIAFVSSLSSSGVANLAPFSYFQLISHDPPLVIISIASANSSRGKDTTENIRATKDFTVNLISDAFVEGANWTAVNAPPEIDEWEGSGLTKLKSSIVNPPRVAESAFSLECTFHSVIDFPSAVDPSVISTTLVVGLIKLVHVRTDVLNAKGDAVDLSKLKPVLRLGAISYGSLQSAYNIPRPRWEDVKGELEALQDQKI